MIFRYTLLIYNILLVLLASISPVQAGVAYGPGFEVLIDIEMPKPGREIQLTVHKGKDTIPWSFNEPKPDVEPTTPSTISKKIDRSKPLEPGLKPWSQGFSFDIAGLSLLVTWDGQVYVKNEGTATTQSISLRTPGKVILLEGGFLDRLSIKSASIELPKKMSFQDFSWEPGTSSGSKPADFVIHGDQEIEARNLNIQSKVINHGKIHLQDQGKMSSQSFTNYGLFDGKDWTLRTQTLQNNGLISSSGTLKIDADEGVNSLNTNARLSSQGDLHIHAKRKFVNGGEVVSEKQLVVQSSDPQSKTGEFHNIGKIHAKDSFRIESNRITLGDNASKHPSTLKTEGDGWLVADDGGITNCHGSQITAKSCTIQSDGGVLNYGTLSCNDKLKIDSPALVNEGKIIAQLPSLSLKNLTNSGTIQSPQLEFREKPVMINNYYGKITGAVTLSLPEIQSYSASISTSSFVPTLDRVVIKLKNSENFVLSQPLYIQGKLEIVDDGNGKAGQLIDIQAKLSAKKGIVIQAPQAKVRVGNQSSAQSNKKIPRLEAVDGPLSIHANLADIENGIVVGEKVDVHAPQGIWVGRLIEDPLSNSYITFYRHQNNPNSHSLSHHISGMTFTFLGQTRTSVYDGHHLATLPMAIPNASLIKSKSSLELHGPWKHHGTLEAQDFILNSPSDSHCVASTINVSRDFTLKGSGSLYLQRHTGNLYFNYYTIAGWGPANATQVASGMAKMRIGGKATLGAPSEIGSHKPQIINSASLFDAPKQDPNLAIIDNEIVCGYHQLFYEGTPAQRALLNSAGSIGFHGSYPANFNLETWNYCGHDGNCGGFFAYPASLNKANSFSSMTNAMAGAVKIFKPIRSSYSTMIHQATTAPILGNHSAGACEIILLNENGLQMGSIHGSGSLCQATLPSSIPNQTMPTRINLSTITLISDAELAAKIAADQKNFIQTVHIPDDVKSFTAKTTSPVYFKMISRYWEDRAAAEKFYQDIQDDIFVATKDGFKKAQKRVFSMSPDLLLNQVVRPHVENTLRRGFLYPQRPLDLEILQELHRNTSEYVKEIRGEVTGPELEQALAFGPALPGIPVPKKPMIYYKSIVNEGGLEQLVAVPYIPVPMIQQALGRGGDRFLTKRFMVLPKEFFNEKGFNHEKLMAFLRHNFPELQDGPILPAIQSTQVRTLEGPNADPVPAVGAVPVPTDPQTDSTQLNIDDQRLTFKKTGPVTLESQADIATDEVIIASPDDLCIHGNVYARKLALLTSLLGDTTIESKKERIYELGNTENFNERIVDQAKVHVDGVLAILAGKDVQRIGAEIKSAVESHTQALGHILNLPATIIYQNIIHHHDKKKNGIEIAQGYRQLPSSNESKVIKEIAGGAIINVAHQSHASEKISRQAKGNITLEAGSNANSYERHITGKTGSGLTKQKYTDHAQSFTYQSIPSQDHAPVVEMQSETGNLILTGAQILGDLNYSAPKGILSLNAAENKAESSSVTSKSNLAWQSMRDSKSIHNTFTPTIVTGKIEGSSQGIVVQRVDGQTPDFVNRIQQIGEPNENKSDDLNHGQLTHNHGQLAKKITYQDLSSTHIETSKKVKGPTKEFGALVAIATAILTQGQGTALAGALGAAEEGVAEAMIAAAYSSACSQVAGSALSSQGRLSNFLDTFCSSNTLKSIATSAATAGLTHHIADRFGIEVKKPEGLVQHAQRAFLMATTSSAMNTAINGEKLKTALDRTLRSGIANTVGGYAANQIGAAYAEENINCLTHKGLHAALGAGMGAILDRDTIRGALSGATAACASEVVVAMLTDSPEDIAKRIRNRAKEQRIRHTKESFAKAFRQEFQSSLNLAKCGAAMINFLAGQNIDVGNAAATNALENNSCYRINRKIEIAWIGRPGDEATDPTPSKLDFSHTFIIVADDQKRVTDTFGWGNDGKSWHHNAPNDLKAAQEAVDKGLVHNISDQVSDQAMERAYQIKSLEAPHFSWGVLNNCKFEADSLVNLARKLTQSKQFKESIPPYPSLKIFSKLPETD